MLRIIKFYLGEKFIESLRQDVLIHLIIPLLEI